VEQPSLEREAMIAADASEEIQSSIQKRRACCRNWEQESLLEIADMLVLEGESCAADASERLSWKTRSCSLQMQPEENKISSVGQSVVEQRLRSSRLYWKTRLL
jgi:hypothetical protein